MSCIINTKYLSLVIRLFINLHFKLHEDGWKSWYRGDCVIWEFAHDTEPNENREDLTLTNTKPDIVKEILPQKAIVRKKHESDNFDNSFIDVTE